MRFCSPLCIIYNAVEAGETTEGEDVLSADDVRNSIEETKPHARFKRYIEYWYSAVCRGVLFTPPRDALQNPVDPTQQGVQRPMPMMKSPTASVLQQHALSPRQTHRANPSAAVAQAQGAFGTPSKRPRVQVTAPVPTNQRGGSAAAMAESDMQYVAVAVTDLAQGSKQHGFDAGLGAFAGCAAKLRLCGVLLSQAVAACAPLWPCCKSVNANVALVQSAV